jgi:two-component system sensor histidine kinase DesK
LAALFLGEGEGGWFVAFIVLAIGVMTAGIRVLSDRGAQYEAMSRELDIVAERERVARDVHDVLGHSLTVVTVKAELAERLVDLDPDRARAELAEIQQLSRQALSEIRATVGGLRAARLDDELEAARSALSGAGIRADLPAGPEDVDPRHRTVLAWVLREAVTNVVRHSEASSCRVELASNALRVIDDGRGLGDRPAGNGLRGLRERVVGAGGTLRVATPSDGRGTVLEVTL